MTSNRSSLIGRRQPVSHQRARLLPSSDEDSAFVVCPGQRNRPSGGRFGE